MKLQSITFKLLSLVSIIFVAIIISIIVVADTQITRIIDSSQNDIYKEKLDVLCSRLSAVNERLHKTGMVEVYEQGFKESILNEFRELYYSEDTDIYPFIFDKNYKVIMHPKIEGGAKFKELGKIFEATFNTHTIESSAVNIYEVIPPKFGSIFLDFKGKEKWYIYQEFEEFNWVICFGVPLDIKYKERDRLRDILLLILAAVMFIALIILFIFITHFTKPIIRLTNISAEFAKGNLDEVIGIDSKDEVGRLASSFSAMRDSINEKIVNLNNEIIERLQAEVSLKEAQNYIENIINSMPSIVVGVDYNCYVTHWNSMAVKKTQREIVDVINTPLIQALPFIEPQISKVYESIKNSKIAINKSVEYKVGDKIHYYDITIYPINSNDEKGAVIRIEDVTEQHHMQAELNQSRRMDAVGQLVGGVAHDFNNMLSGIITASQLLKIQPEALTKKSIELVEIIEQASFRATELIAQLLLFSRKSDNMSSSISIHSLLNDVTLLLKRSLDKKIDLTVSKNAVVDTIIGDRSQIQNSIMNICINASHAMPNGGEIRVNTRNVIFDENFCKISQFDITPGDFLEIELRDSGTGIEEENLSKIFDPFFTTKEQGKGTGLGLSSVYGIVKNHNGSINVYSDVGVGTVFHIYLPITDQLVEQSEIIEPIRGQGLILLVDDEDIIRKTVEGMLTSLGYEVIVAVNGQEGVDKYSLYKEQIDIVILDMIMPIMNGKEVFEEIKKINSDCKVILSSGFSKTEDVVEMKKKGLTDFIRKPYRFEYLSQVLAENLTE